MGEGAVESCGAKKTHYEEDLLRPLLLQLARCSFAALTALSMASRSMP